MGYNKYMARKKNKKVNIIFIVTMIVILGYFYYKFDASQSLQNKDDENEIVASLKTFPDNLTIEKQTLNLKPKWYKEVSAEYPVGDVAGVKEAKEEEPSASSQVGA